MLLRIKIVVSVLLHINCVAFVFAQVEERYPFDERKLGKAYEVLEPLGVNLRTDFEFVTPMIRKPFYAVQFRSARDEQKLLNVLKQMPIIDLQVELELPFEIVTDEHLEEISRLSNVTAIKIRYQGSTQTKSPVTAKGYQHLKKMPSLLKLTLEYDSFRSPVFGDEEFSAISEIPALESLSLSFFKTQVTRQGIERLRKSNSLSNLSVSGEAFTLEMLGIIDSIKPWKELSVNSLKLTDEVIKQWGSSDSLLRLSIRSPFLSDSGVMELKKLKQLRSLSVSGVKISGEGFADLQNLKTLKSLEIDSSSIDGNGLVQICRITGLERLSITSQRKVKITDLGVKDISKLQNLQELDLSNSDLSDVGLKELYHIKNLKWLNLERTLVTGDGMNGFHAAFPNCIITYRPR